jgi:hypothetical protein
MQRVGAGADIGNGEFAQASITVPPVTPLTATSARAPPFCPASIVTVYCTLSELLPTFFVTFRAFCFW